MGFSTTRPGGVMGDRTQRLKGKANEVKGKTIAVLALRLAFGDGGKATDPQGAFRVLAQRGWTRALLVLLACGFVAYALWRLAQALFNRGGHGHDPSGYGRRLIQLCQALIYIVFAISAVR